MKSAKIRNIAVSAMLIAVAFIATMITSSIKVQFLSLDIKDAVLSIVALLFGPVYGLISVAAVSCLEFVTISTTGWYGLVMNIFSSGTFVLVTGFIYKYKRSFSGAIIAAICTVFSVTIVMCLANYFITPIYMDIMGLTPFLPPIEVLIPSLILPFNLSKSIINCALMLLLYKPFTTALKKCNLLQSKSDAEYKFNLKSAVLTVVSVLIIIAVILYLILVLKLKIA